MRHLRDCSNLRVIAFFQQPAIGLKRHGHLSLATAELLVSLWPLTTLAVMLLLLSQQDLVQPMSFLQSSVKEIWLFIIDRTTRNKKVKWVTYRVFRVVPNKYNVAYGYSIGMEQLPGTLQFASCIFSL